MIDTLFDENDGAEEGTEEEENSGSGDSLDSKRNIQKGFEESKELSKEADEDGPMDGHNRKGIWDKDAQDSGEQPEEKSMEEDSFQTLEDSGSGDIPVDEDNDQTAGVSEVGS